MKRFLSVALIAASILPVAGPASAGVVYRDTHFDANDVRTNPDVRSTTRKVTMQHAHRFLIVVVRTYGNWPGPQRGFHVKVPLDSRGGPRADAHLHMRCCKAVSDVTCTVDPVGLGTRLRVHGDTAICRVPASFVNTNKRIRWKVIATDGSYHHPDAAPNDRSWYT